MTKRPFVPPEVEELELENAEMDVLEAELEDADDDDELELERIGRAMEKHLKAAAACAARIHQRTREASNGQ